MKITQMPFEHEQGNFVLRVSLILTRTVTLYDYYKNQCIFIPSSSGKCDMTKSLMVNNTIGTSQNLIHVFNFNKFLKQCMNLCYKISCRTLVPGLCIKPSFSSTLSITRVFLSRKFNSTFIYSVIIKISMVAQKL